MSTLNDSENLVFQRATPDQIVKHFENNGQVWAGPLAQKDYLHLQHELSDAKANQGRVGYWVFHYPSEPDKIISSCTTYVRDIIISVGQGSRVGMAMVVTDIVTHPEHRMKGMASMLLKKLQEMTDDWKDPPVECTIIYSDLHTEFVERLGWKPHPATQLRILLGRTKMECDVKAENSKIADDQDKLWLLDYQTLYGWADRDANMAKLRLAGMKDKKTHVQLVPSEAVTRWHLVRSKLFQHHLVKDKTLQPAYGAAYINRETQRGVWGWWTHDFRTRKLYIGRLMTTRYNGMEERIMKLLHAAVAEASNWGLREVVLWEPTAQVTAGAEMLAESLEGGIKTVVEDRAGMVPCLRWRSGVDKEVIWEEPQYYGWI